MAINFNEPLYIILFTFNGLTFVGLLIISFLFFKFKNHYNKLIGKPDRKSLQNVLDEILDVQKNYSRKYEELRTMVEGIEKDGAFHLQKIGFKRFNPFEDTGGDQSFATAILDDHKNGIVLSALHSRDTTRVYAKKITGGKSPEMPLSKEEESVITNAKSSNS